MSKMDRLRQRLAAEEDWSDVSDEDFFNKPYKPRKMSIDLTEIDHMDSLHNEASWNAGQKAMKRFEKELSHPFSRKYALKNMNDHAFNSGTVLQNNYSDIERIMEKNDNKKLFSLLEGHNKDILDSSNFNIEREFGFGEESPRPTNKGEEMGRGIGEIFDRFKDEDYAKIPDRKGDMLKTKQIMNDYTNDVSGGIMKGFGKYRTSKLRQHIAQVRLAYAGPPIDVINAFRNKEALKMHAKSKKGKELSFQTDGETLFQSGYPIAQHTETGINFSYQGHPSASTAQAGRMLGINTFHAKGKYYINGSEVDPTQYDYTDVPFKDIQEGTVKVNKNIKTIPMTPEKRQLMKDQDHFSTKARRELKDPETGEIYDQVVVQPEDQEEINRVTGLDTPIPEETFATEIHHSLPKSKAPALRRSTAGAVALSPRSHQEAHFPERFVKRSLKKARLKIARMRQRNISRGVPRIAMGALARNVMQKARGNPFFKRGDTPVGYVYDEDKDVFLDATKRVDAKAIRKKHGKEGQWLGINSITDTRKGTVKKNDAGFLQIERELDYIEDVRKNRPVLGGYENSLEASYPVVGDEKTILDKLKSESVLKHREETQKSSLGIDPQGTAYILYPDGKRDLLTQD